MTQASAHLDRAASKIARAPNANAQNGLPQDTVELSSSVVDLLQAKNDFAANAKAFRVMNEMNRAVLDMLV